MGYLPGHLRAELGVADETQPPSRGAWYEALPYSILMVAHDSRALPRCRACSHQLAGVERWIPWDGLLYGPLCGECHEGITGLEVSWA